MRRRAGTGLVTNELRLLLTAADLQKEGQGSFHGYDIARRLARTEGANSVMSQPTLYRALRRLEQRGALSSHWESPETARAEGREGRPRRYYSLSPAGAQLAISELRTLELEWHRGQLRPSTTT
jgi:PadR family transcriptional regulator PadR